MTFSLHDMRAACFSRVPRGAFLGAAAAALALGAGPSLAQDSGMVALNTADQGRQWQAVGRLDLGARGFCTATLIDDITVLTAAHCLFDKETGARVALEDLHFSAGLRNGRAVAYRGVVATAAHPDYLYAGVEDLDRVGFDVALIRLDQPVRLPSVQPFAVAERPHKGAAIGVVSYAQDHAEAPALQSTCHVIDEATAISVLTCTVDFGASGSPVFDLSRSPARVVSVISAKARLKDKPVSLAVAVSDILPTLLSEIEAQTGDAHNPDGVNLLSGGLARAGAGGAKFVTAKD